MKDSPKVLSYDANIPKAFSDFDADEFVTGVRNWADSIVGKNDRVALSVSGGVDSTLVAHLLHPVLGDRLCLYFVNDGLRRLIKGRQEYAVVRDMFTDFNNFEVLYTADQLLPALCCVSDGRRKREIMIDHYLKVSNKFIDSVGAKYVADGTIRPDIVTTASKQQRQHNVDIAYRCTKLQPVASLFKPQVRRASMQVGIPAEFAHKIPCPGPAMLLRVGGVFTENKLELAKLATDEVEQAVDNHFSETWGKPYKYNEETGTRTPFQHFAYAIDQGMFDDRQLSMGLSGVAGKKVKCYITDTDAMVIDPAVERQTGELYKKIAWIESVDLLDFEAMNAVQGSLEKSGYPRAVFQIASGKSGGFPVGMKVVESDDAMTARTMGLPIEYISEVGGRIAGYGAGRVGYEISCKPPATIELF
ncbi:MAG: hypothetical protein JXC85_02305 [Candidatus Aenigmarchaeota archaeon]|nr:hypothetical protein [Candidatus Aenigmarchaeota archaeon]